MKDMTYSWKLDSIGSRGARSLIYVRITERCGLVGMKWNDVEEYFGTPNEGGTVHFHYYSKVDSNYHYPILEYILIEVDSNTKRVSRFEKRYRDPW